MEFHLAPAREERFAATCSSRQVNYCVALGKTRVAAEELSPGEARQYIHDREPVFLLFQQQEDNKSWADGEIREQHRQCIANHKSVGLPLLLEEDDNITDDMYDTRTHDAVKAQVATYNHFFRQRKAVSKKQMAEINRLVEEYELDDSYSEVKTDAQASFVIDQIKRHFGKQSKRASKKAIKYMCDLEKDVARTKPEYKLDPNMTLTVGNVSQKIDEMEFIQGNNKKRRYRDIKMSDFSLEDLQAIPHIIPNAREGEPALKRVRRLEAANPTLGPATPPDAAPKVAAVD